MYNTPEENTEDPEEPQQPEPAEKEAPEHEEWWRNELFETHGQEAAKDIISHVYNVQDNAEQKLLRTCYYSVV